MADDHVDIHEGMYQEANYEEDKPIQTRQRSIKFADEPTVYDQEEEIEDRGNRKSTMIEIDSEELALLRAAARQAADGFHEAFEDPNYDEDVEVALEEERAPKSDTPVEVVWLQGRDPSQPNWQIGGDKMKRQCHYGTHYRRFMEKDDPLNGGEFRKRFGVGSTRPMFKSTDERKRAFYLYYYPAVYYRMRRKEQGKKITKKKPGQWRIGTTPWPTSDQYVAVLKSEIDFDRAVDQVVIDDEGNKTLLEGLVWKVFSKTPGRDEFGNPLAPGFRPDTQITTHLILDMSLAVEKDLQKAESEMGRGEYKSSGKGFLTRRVSSIVGDYPLLSMTLINAATLCIAAAVYSEIELPFEKEQEQQYDDAESDFTTLITTCNQGAQSGSYTQCSQACVGIAGSYYDRLQEELASLQIGPSRHRSVKEYDWSYSGSFLFSLTVATTVGYGNQTPATSSAKLFTIFYTLCAVPIMFAWFGVLGEVCLNLLHKTLKESMSVRKECDYCQGTGMQAFPFEHYPCKHCKGGMWDAAPEVISKDLQDQTKRMLIARHIPEEVVKAGKPGQMFYDGNLREEPADWKVHGLSIIIIVLYIFCFMAPIYTKLTADYPVGVFPHGEWSYLESVYFATISYSSVGFGDYSWLSFTGAGMYVVNIVGLLVGMTLYAILVVNAQEKIESIAHIHHAVVNEADEEWLTGGNECQVASDFKEGGGITKDEPYKISEV